MSKDTAYHEIEFKLDADCDDTLREAMAWVQKSPRIFMPLKDPVPRIMEGRLLPSFERTRGRVRRYFDSVDLDLFKNGIEIRQEAREKGGYKQMVKIDRPDNSSDDMMDRDEYPGVCHKIGVDFDEVEDKLIRRRLMNDYGGLKLKPLVVMVSQRLRLKYHPEGDTGIEIEAAFDVPCCGFALNKYVWEAPEMELEIIKGPEKHAAALALLEREAARFKKFGLKRTATSKPTPGFAGMGEFLKGREGQKAFKNLKLDQEWWMDPDLEVSPVVRPHFAGTTSLARRLRAS